MKILYIGDVMGDPGLQVVEQVLPDISADVDLIIAQSENVTNGKSMSIADMKRLQAAGVRVFTGGNHTPSLLELHELLEDPAQPVVGPANMPDCPGPGYKFVETSAGRVLVISLLGATVGRAVESTNALAKIDVILDETRAETKTATVVNFHGDYSSEKRVIGYYLDGRVSMVIGDHWHVPTADAMVLPKGTAHISDVGMCGTVHSSLGVKTEVIVARWRDGKVNSNVLETKGPLQFNAVIADIDEATGLARSVEHIQKIIE